MLDFVKSSTTSPVHTDNDVLFILSSKLREHLESCYGLTVNAADRTIITSAISAANYVSLLTLEYRYFFQSSEDAIHHLETLRTVAILEWMMPCDISIIRVGEIYQILVQLIESCHRVQRVEQVPGWKGVWMRLFY